MRGLTRRVLLLDLTVSVEGQGPGTIPVEVTYLTEGDEFSDIVAITYFTDTNRRVDMTWIADLRGNNKLLDAVREACIEAFEAMRAGE